MDALRDCFGCKRCITSGVILYCECRLAFCTDCALKQISKSNETYKSSIYCPCCKKSPSSRAHSESRQIDRDSKDEAATEEFELLKSAFEWCFSSSYEYNRYKDQVNINAFFTQLVLMHMPFIEVKWL